MSNIEEEIEKMVIEITNYLQMLDNLEAKKGVIEMDIRETKARLNELKYDLKKFVKDNNIKDKTTLKILNVI